MKIAIVEDNKTFADQLQSVLQKEKYETEVFYNAASFLNNFSDKIDLVLLDISLPDKNGLEVLNSLRELQYNLKVIFISSHTDIEYLKKAYKLGCEDYIKKPFDLEEALLKIERIKKLVEPDDVIVMGNYKFDLKNYLVYLDSQELKITKKESKLLKIFLANVDKVVTFEYLNNKIWDGGVVTNTIIVSVLRLKTKLKLENLQNVREVGYIFHKL